MLGPQALVHHQSRRSPRAAQEQRLHRTDHSKRSAWIWAGSVELPGVSIGHNSEVAAHRVVTDDVPPNALYAGAPARFKKCLVVPHEA